MKTLLSVLLYFISFTVVAQKTDSTHTHYRYVRGGFIEHSTELKSQRGIKNGIATILAGKKKFATGIYKNNERIGRWHFFCPLDTLEQIYNYSTKKLEYNVPIKEITYEIDSLKEGDKVSYPAKIGGNLYGMYFLTERFRIPSELKHIKGFHKLNYIFTVSNSGQLLNYEVKIISPSYNKTEIIDLAKFHPDDLAFVPAKVNGRAVKSKLIVNGDVTVD
ncbi:hypothetical protein OQX63_20520 [Pedobacter sp. PF22-3]|uniref:hypothetical protein n=1 Tax=Pedobacter sp. PF22-3 TaxID=2994467 RepID=UPI00224731E1|nr:hypothetical protein [Pedobacter sp. PF22-3]MCX2495891.1 hypothetical protein [Pedobacter sp. PF22-3]